MALDLTEDEKLALVRLLRKTLDEDRFPFAPRLDPIKAILAKLDPPAPRPEPPPPSNLASRRASAEDGEDDERRDIIAAHGTRQPPHYLAEFARRRFSLHRINDPSAWIAVSFSSSGIKSPASLSVFFAFLDAAAALTVNKTAKCAPGDVFRRRIFLHFCCRPTHALS
jgi:hypothetical protein